MPNERILIHDEAFDELLFSDARYVNTIVHCAIIDLIYRLGLSFYNTHIAVLMTIYSVSQKKSPPKVF